MLLARAHGRLHRTRGTGELLEEYADFSWTEKKGARRCNSLRNTLEQWTWVGIRSAVCGHIGVSHGAVRERWMGWIVKMCPTMGAIQESRSSAHFTNPY